MKKIIALIVIVCSISIGLFIWYMSSGVDTRDVYYDSITTYEDITYKRVSEQSLKFDIIMPTKDVFDEIPVIFFVHGGDFTSGDKSELTDGVRRYIVEDLLEEGYAIVSLNYRYLDEDTDFPDNLTDVNDAIKYTTSISEAYNLDVDNYGIWGVEAGAFLALTIAYSENGFFGGDSTLNEFSADIKYVMSFSGVTNIISVDEINSLSIAELDALQTRIDLLYGEGFDVFHIADYLITLNRYEPTTYVSDDTVSTYIIHGLNDELVNVSQARFLRDDLTSHSLSSVYREVVGGDANLSELPEAERDLISQEVVNFVKSNYIEN